MWTVLGMFHVAELLPCYAFTVISHTMAQDEAEKENEDEE